MNSGRLDGERRKWPRLPLAIPVFVRGQVRGQDGKSQDFLEFATALNVSAGGMLIAMRRILQPLIHLQLEIPSAPVAELADLPSASRSLTAKALRNTPAEGYYLLGLKFSRPLVDSSVGSGVRRRKIAVEV